MSGSAGDPWFSLYAFVRDNVKIIEAEDGVDVNDKEKLAEIMRHTALKSLHQVRVRVSFRVRVWFRVKW